MSWASCSQYTAWGYTANPIASCGNPYRGTGDDTYNILCNNAIMSPGVSPALFQFQRGLDWETYENIPGTPTFDSENNRFVLVDEMAGIDPYYALGGFNWRYRIVMDHYVSDWLQIVD